MADRFVPIDVAARHFGVRESTLRARLHRGSAMGLRPRSASNPSGRWLVQIADSPEDERRESIDVELSLERAERLAAERRLLEERIARLEADLRAAHGEIDRLGRTVDALVVAVSAASRTSRNEDQA